MAVDIGPKIGIDGEAEFRKELQNINQQLRTLGSEMKAVTSSFEDGDRSEEALAAQTDVLNRQIDAQRQKLSQLERGLDAAADKFGTTDTKTLRWAQAVNDARADLNRLESQLKSTTGEVDDFGDAMDDAGQSGSGLMGMLGSSGLGGLLSKGLAVGAVVGGIQQVVGAMFDLVDSTQEYRSIMASLEVSSQAAGYSAEETAATYERLQSVLGDSQTAATATANLQAIGLSQEQLMEVTDAAIGAWARYGDSIPIDGLAESINETIQAGQVTGTFADVLNWAGTSEDDFNTKLQAASSTSERANLVMQELANQGLADTGAAWIENNKDITATNASTEKWNSTMARLGGMLAPVAATIKSLGADAINFLLDQVEAAIASFTELPGRALNWGRDLIDSFVNGIKEKVGAVVDAVKNVAGTVADFLGFSEPERGPLSNFHTFAPDMMDLYSQGIRDNAWKVTDAMDSVAGRMQQSVPTPTVETVERAAAGMVNGVQTAVAGGGNYRVEIPIIINGREFSRAILPDLRAVEKSNPEVVSGV